MKPAIAITIFYSLAWITLSCFAQQDQKWDQQKAKAKVQQMLEVESQGLPWNEIRWREDESAAIKESVKTNKPILLFFAVKTNVGPAEAPC